LSTITSDDAVTAADLAAEIAAICGQRRKFNARHAGPLDVPSRPLAEIYRDARRADCGCWTYYPTELCAFTGPAGEPGGVHMARLA
jgi:hypothetical protein